MRRLALLLAAMLLVGACGSSSSTEPELVSSNATVVDDVDAPTAALAATSASREVAEAPAEPELDPEAVVAATLLIASGGDLEAAIDEGLVTEAEAEAALAALESGSVGDLLD